MGDLGGGGGCLHLLLLDLHTQCVSIQIIYYLIETAFFFKLLVKVVCLHSLWFDPAVVGMLYRINAFQILDACQAVWVDCSACV